MKLLVVSCSLSPVSHSAVLARRLAEAWSGSAEVVDLRECPLPLCDGDEAYEDPAVVALAARIEAAHAVALAVPIYNYDVGGAARNLIAMTGSAWRDKVVGLIAAAGGQRSYMSLMPLANSLMLDFRCVIVPRFVYASRHSFAEHRLQDPEIEQRLDSLARDLHRFASALRCTAAAG